MTLRFVHGKPGSGKSAYTTWLVAKQLADWVRYDLEHDEPYSRVLYTNIPLNIEAINEHLSKELCIKDVDVSEHIEVLDDTFFRTADGEYREWWLDFPEGAFIVIDEVHHYLPASVKRKKGGQDYADKFTNYVSMHRHRQHDIILLSQHIDNVSPEVKKQIDTVYEVLNVKNLMLGIFPFRVPMADVDVVREAWGFPVQVAHIKRGVCEARKVVYDKVCDVFVLTPAIFSLYRSHTKSDEALDRPSLKLGRIGSLVWFARRHLMRFVLMISLTIGVLMAVRNMFVELPGALVSALAGGVQSESLTPPESKAASVSSVPVVRATPSVPVSSESQSVTAADLVVPVLVDDAVKGFVKNGVITPKGILRAGDKMIFEGVEETIVRVNFFDSTIYFKSDKKFQK